MPKLLWANAYCLLDTSSGASITVRTMLQCLQQRGWEIEIIGATVFDSRTGRNRLLSFWDKVEDKSTKILPVQDGALLHHLVKTSSTNSSLMTVEEENVWFKLYRQRLRQFQPDVVYYYGGKSLDLLIPIEAKRAAAATAALLVNGNYEGDRWSHDLDLIITDSEATAQLYEQENGLSVLPVGPFVDKQRVVPAHHERKRLTFINPVPSKGAFIVVRLAQLLEEKRPDIELEVVESRGAWAEVSAAVHKADGERPRELRNVTITPNQPDIRDVYSRSRVLLVPSLWFDSMPRVAIEAMFNGLPVVGTNRGGIPETIGRGGVKIDFPPEFYEKPYARIPSQEQTRRLMDAVLKFFDDEQYYADRVKAVYEQAENLQIDESADKLEIALTECISKTRRFP